MKSYILDLIENWVIAVCETFEEAKDSENSWASAVLLVSCRWWDLDDVEVTPSKQLIKEAVLNLEIPVFVRVRFWHFWEAYIAEELWANAIIESLKWDESLDKALNIKHYQIPIISEITSYKDVKKWQENYLLLWDWATWNLVPLTDSLKVYKERYTDKNIFVWGWIWNPADIKILSKIWWIKWYFIWTAMFDVWELEVKIYLKEVISYIKEVEIIRK